MKRTIGIVSIALVAALTSACRQNDADSADANAEPSTAESAAEGQAPASAVKAAGGILDACSLVSLADAESILGTPAKLSEHQPDDERSSSCHFDSVDETQGVNNLAVEINTDEDAAEAKQELAFQKQREGAEALPGIGDEALLLVNKQPDVGADAPAASVAMLPDQQVLVAIKGARKIEIMTNYFGRPRSTDSLKALGKKLADGL